MTNVFNASFDDLLAQAGVATGQMTTAPKAEEPKEDVAAPTPVPNFDDLLSQAGIQDVTPQENTEETPVEPNITEEYRVSTDIFGENDKPKEVPTFEDLMAKAGAGAVETETRT